MEMKQYVKDANGCKRGVMIAIVDGDQVNIGFSQCSKRDKFDRELGVEIASNRATAYSTRESVEKIPFAVAQALPKFIGRCERYFKACSLPVWADNMCPITED